MDETKSPMSLLVLWFFLFCQNRQNLITSYSCCMVLAVTLHFSLSFRHCPGSYARMEERFKKYPDAYDDDKSTKDKHTDYRKEYMKGSQCTKLSIVA